MRASTDACYISTDVRVSDVIPPHTIAIHVVIAGVPFAVAVGVPLVRVLHHAAVVAGIAMAVLVAVLLVHIGLQPAVVLKTHTHTRNKGLIHSVLLRVYM